MKIFTIFLVIGLMFTSCDQPVGDQPSSNALLSGVTISGVQADLGSPSTDWRAVYDGKVTLTAEQASNAAVKASISGKGAKVYLSVVKADDLESMPIFGTASGFTFSSYDSLYIEVFSANHDVVIFYKIVIEISDLATLKSVTLRAPTTPTNSVEDRVASSLGTPATTWSAAAAGEIITRPGFFTANIVAIPNSPKAALRYGTAATEGTEPVFATNNTLTFVADGFIYIEVTSDGPVPVVIIYKILVKINNSKTDLDDILIGGVSVKNYLGSLGTKGEVHGRVDNYAGVFSIPPAGAVYAASLTNPVITVTPPSGVILGTDLTVKYAWSYRESEDMPLAVEWANSITGTVPNGSYIGVKVTASDGSVGYYKFRATVTGARSDTPAISNITLNGTNITASLGTSDVNFVTANEAVNLGILNLTSYSLNSAASHTFEAILSDPTKGAQVGYSLPKQPILSGGSFNVPAGWNTGIFTLNGGERLVIRVLAEDGIEALYYVLSVIR